MTAEIVDLAACRGASAGAAAVPDEVPLDDAIAICLVHCKGDYPALDTKSVMSYNPVHDEVSRSYCPLR